MGMLCFDLDIELLEDCVFSERRTTFGMPRGLDYVPGAKLMGAAAARLYATLGDRAFQVFHRGHVRFGNGLPVGDAGDVGYPMPCCWHVPKREEESVARLEGRRQLDARQVLNGQFRLDPRDRQLRAGFVTERGEWLRPARGHAPRTAHTPGWNKAEEGRLFGYDALHAGQRFRACVAVAGDTASDRDVLERLCEALAADLSVGRSRSAEYGHVRCSAGTVRALDAVAVSGTTLNLWLLSDLAARDEDSGAPTLSPTPGSLGLPEGRLVPEKSFVRARGYSPYNTHWRAPECERQVIERGSVLAFELDREPNMEERTRLAFGIGDHVASGLGQVLCNHPLLSASSPVFEDLEPVHRPDAVAPPETGVAGWLLRASNRSAEGRLHAWLEVALRQWRGALGENPPAGGPGRSQWSAVATIAESCEDAGRLRQQLFRIEGAPCRADDEAWRTAMGDAGSYADWLGARIGELGLERWREIPAGLAIGALARAIRQQLPETAP